MNRFGRLTGACAAGATLLLADAAEADVFFVPYNFPTIQAAIDAAGPGDEIEVSPGTYSESISFLGKAITVRSVTFGGPELTIIDAGGLGSVVQCVSGEGPGSVLEGFTLTGGMAVRGGGMYNFGSSPTVENCWFVGNTATSFGGGMHNDNFAGPSITNCRFLGNTAIEGGGLCEEGSFSTLTGCVFSGNTANIGAGIANLQSSSTTVINCAFGGNQATTAGGAIRAAADVSVSNSILWGNLPEQVSVSGTPTVTVDWSNIQGGWAGAGSSNIDADPLFVDVDGLDTIVGTADDDLRLQPGSPCIDAGDNTVVPGSVTTDLDGGGRFKDDPTTPDTGNPDGVNPIVDLGAYEYTCVQNVTAGTCHPSIQDAVDLASDGDEIIVGPGTYAGVFLSGAGVSVTVRSAAGPAMTNLEGGAGGSSTIFFGDSPASLVLEGFTITHPTGFKGAGVTVFSSGPLTMIDCIVTGNRGVSSAAGVDVLDSQVIMTDCVITANSESTYPTSTGVGLVARQSDLTMTNCTISDHASEFPNSSGVGASLVECTLDLTGCTISGNHAMVAGGGMSMLDCTGTIAGCTFLDNSAGQGGGGAVFLGGVAGATTPSFVDCTFTGNEAESGPGGAVVLASTNSVFSSCFFTNNAGETGGAINSLTSTCVLTDCTFVGNAADDPGGAIYANAGSMTMDGCTFTANSADTGAGFYGESGDYDLDNCDFNGNLSVGLAGGVYLVDATGDFSFCEFDSNVAGEDGGGLYQLRSTITVDQSLFTDNISGLFGGAITNAFQGDVTLTGCLFIENSAGIFGGAIRNSTCDPLIDNCTFVGNSASVLGGGAIHNFNSDPVIQDSDFEFNSTDGRGGAIIATLDSDVAVSGCTFTDNTAEDGGAVAGDEGTVSLTGCVFETNIAEDQGGAIFNREGTLSVDGCAFDGNMATIGDAVFDDRDGIVHACDTIAGNVFSRGSLSPGAVDIGALTIDADYAQVGVLPGFGAVSGSLLIEMAGPGAGTGYDTLDVTGNAELGGGLFVRLLGGFEPTLGQSFDILSAGSTVGTFDAAFFPGLPGGRLMRAAYAGGAESGPGGAVTVIIESLGTLLGFDDPISESIAGLPAGVAVGDFDDANGPDLAITVPADLPGAPGSVLILLNAGTDGGGNWLGFASTTQITVGVEPAGIAAARLDGGMSLDLAVVNAGDATDNLIVLANDGTGVFTPLTSTTTGTEPRDVAAGDFDGDMIVDLAVANAGDGTVVFLDNDGAGTMALTGTVNTGLRPESIYADILDEDKCIDVVAGNALSGTATVMMNQGGGVFGPTSNIEVGAGPADVITGDLNGDGLPEIVTANLGDDGIAGTVSVIVNEGGGVFSSAVNYPVGDDTRSVTIVDLELDGDNDIAVVADDEMGIPAVQVLRNDTAPAEPLSFADADDFGFGDDPVLVTAGDLDNDGAADLIAVNAGIGAFAEGGAASGGGLGSVNVLINQTEACPADIDGNGEVDVNDLVEVIIAWGVCPPEPCPADVNDDGVVNVNDLVMVITAWGVCG